MKRSRATKSWTSGQIIKACLVHFRATGELPVIHELASTPSLPLPRDVHQAFEMPVGRLMRDIANDHNLASVYRSRKTRHVKWNRAAVRKAVLAYFQRYGEFPSNQDGRYRHDLPDPRTVARMGTVWGEIITELVVETGAHASIYANRFGNPGGPVRTWTLPEAASAVCAFARRNHRLPTTRECRASADLPHPRVLSMLFGTHFAGCLNCIADTNELNVARASSKRRGVDLTKHSRRQRAPISDQGRKWARETIVARGLSAFRFLKAYRKADGRFGPTSEILREAGIPISVEMAGRIAKDIFRQRPDVYKAFWAEPPLSLEGNVKPGEFEAKLAVLREYAQSTGNVFPPKKFRPNGVNLYQWIKNQELRIGRGNMPEENLAALRALPGGEERFGSINSELAAAD